MKLHQIEGNTQKLDGGAMYGNAPRALWQQWSNPDEHNRISLACRALLLTTDDGKNILFEAGVGAFFEPKLRERYGVIEQEHKLLNNLSAIGIHPENVHEIILSHLHFDHAGGILSAFEDGEPHLVFPNATFYVSAKQWERATNPHPRDKTSYIPVLNKLLEKSNRLELIEKDQFSPLIKFHFSDGHTPGLMLSEIKLANGPLLFASDLIPAIPWVHLPITTGYDRYPELVVDEKKALLNMLLEKQGKIFFTHDPTYACGAVKMDDKHRFYAEPISLKDCF